MNFINQCLDYTFPVAVGLIVVLGVMVLGLLVTCLATSYKHQRDKAYVKG